MALAKGGRYAMCDSKDGAAASMPLLPRRWQRVEMPVAELVVELESGELGRTRSLV